MSADELKKRAAVYAADYIQQDMIIGLGTGSTIYWLIKELATRVEHGLRVTVVPTSKETQRLAGEFHIPLANLNDVEKLALTIDGADEVDGELNLIKGGGGALLQEKIVAAASDRLIIVADNSKLVGQLGKFPLPVEVIDFGYRQVQKKIAEMGCSKVVRRQREDKIFITDHGHYILDCYFEKIHDAANLNTALHQVPGVVETGLFINMASEVVVALPDGSITVIRK